MNARFWAITLALALFVSIGSPSRASESPSMPGFENDADLAIAVANGAAVPSNYLAPQGGTEVLPGSESFTVSEVRALVEPIQRGYSEGILFKQGNQVLASVTYPSVHEAGLQLVVVRAGVLNDPASIQVVGAVVFRQITDETALATVARPGQPGAQTQEMEMTIDGWKCVGAFTAVTLLVIACGLATGGNPYGLAACGGGAVIGGGIAGDVCRKEAEEASMTVSLTPKAQTVSGCGPCANGQANFYITGSSTVPATRELYPAGFAICSACPSNYFAHNAVGSTYHYFSPLANCGYSSTVWGAIYYSSGSKYDTADVHISRPTCFPLHVL